MFDKAYEEGVISKIFVTNATYKDEKIISRPWFCDVDVSKYIAKLINAVNCNQSTSPLLNPIDKIKHVKERFVDLKELKTQI
jgi:ribose-phosphate pyrophosphokinase